MKLISGNWGPQEDRAVVDIGSNSVRLVVYRVQGRANAPILNEKVQAALGRGLPQTERLSPEGVVLALEALKRFSLLIASMGISRVDVIATAAVRDALDGPEFVARVRETCGLTVRVITGEEEARYSAQGVLAGAPDADGVAGDLGGSSLELVRLSQQRLDAQESWQLGPLSLPVQLDPLDVDAATAHVARVLDGSGILNGGQTGRSFFAVGGAWRSLAKVDMALHGYPLPVLHNYRIPRPQALETCTFLLGQSRKSLERMKIGVSKRAETLPYSALLLREVLLRGTFDRVVLSAFGVREGLLLEGLSPGNRQMDPLVAGAIAMLGGDSRAIAFAEELFAWVNPPFANLPQLFSEQRGVVLRSVACLLSDIGALLHPDDRAKLAFELVLRAPYPAASHAERVYLARVIARRYCADASGFEPDMVNRLLDPERIARADALGAALRLGADLSGRSAALLRSSRLGYEQGVLVLRLDEGAEALASDYVRKRLAQLGQALGAPVDVRVREVASLERH
jgi:exopolyphosphatase / guanosine-5'-triphosphate,3'-diphosphate pyrophosphatase